MISSVIEGGGAEEAGLRQYDVITAINDVEINSFADLSKVLDTKAIGDIVTVTVIREDKEMKFDVELKATSRS